MVAVETTTALSDSIAWRSAGTRYARDFPVPVPAVRLDAALPPHWATAELEADTLRLEPFGEGHRRPLWHLRAEL